MFALVHPAVALVRLCMLTPREAVLNQNHVQSRVMLRGARSSKRRPVSLICQNSPEWHLWVRRNQLIIDNYIDNVNLILFYN